MRPSPVAIPISNQHAELERVVAARDSVRFELLGERTVRGHWVGELASSPSATATAVSALVIAHGSGGTESMPGSASIEHMLQGDLSELIVESLHWLAERQNEDGGWSDTERGRSNVAATLVVQSAFRLTCVPAKYEGLTDRADEYLESQGGIATFKKRYARDKCFSAPILANAALAGLVPWRQVPALPFEYAGLPERWQRYLQLPSASHTIPVLAAVGHLKFHHDRPRNPLTLLMRLVSCKRSLAIIERVQAENGSFFESTSLTAFVVMSLASLGVDQHTIVRRGVEFLLSSVRSNASWPTGSNLAVWNSSLAINALSANNLEATEHVAQSARETVAVGAAWQDTVRVDDVSQREISAAALDENCLDWLLDCQRIPTNPDANEMANGWARTDLPGAAPETDATAGVLMALAKWRHRYPTLKQHRLDLAARRGVEWLLDVQNDDGGWPTFCRAWNDRSATDLTAHALRALDAWQLVWRNDPRRTLLSPDFESRITSAIDRGLRFLEAEQHNDGSFVPLKFGNQFHPEGYNLVYGTARVLIACAELGTLDGDLAQRAGRWLLGVQHANGGWGPPRTSPATSLSNIYRSGSSRAEDALANFCSVEESALAVEALIPLAESNQLYSRAVKNGLKWLVEAVEQGRQRQPAPIGVTFAKGWYHERLYPLVFASSALGSAVRQAVPQHAVVSPVASA